DHGVVVVLGPPVPQQHPVGGGVHPIQHPGGPVRLAGGGGGQVGRGKGEGGGDGVGVEDAVHPHGIHPERQGREPAVLVAEGDRLQVEQDRRGRRFYSGGGGVQLVQGAAV